MNAEKQATFIHHDDCAYGRWLLIKGNLINLDLIIDMLYHEHLSKSSFGDALQAFICAKSDSSSELMNYYLQLNNDYELMYKSLCKCNSAADFIPKDSFNIDGI